MKPHYEVVYGSLGSGKSSYAMGIIDPTQTFKLGVGTKLMDWLYLRFGAIDSHEQENERIGLRYKGTTIEQAVEDIRRVEHQNLMVDDWGSFFNHSFWWKKEKTHERIGQIFETINRNASLQRVLFVSTEFSSYLPFRLYKNRAIWNRRLFEVADQITKIEYGIPIKIK